MATFAVQHGAVPLCTWHLQSGEISAHEKAVLRNGMLVLQEQSRVGFVLDPANEAIEYRIAIGDVPVSDIVPNPDDASGVILGGRVFWRDLNYFDSARGQTPLVLASRVVAAEDEDWVVLLSAPIYVLPSKLGEDRYEAMSSDLRRVSLSLLADLYGKSRKTVDIRYAKVGRTFFSREDELRAIDETLQNVGDLLCAIAQRPAYRIKTIVDQRQFWGEGRLHPTTVAAIARRGIDLKTASRPIRIPARSKVESFDVAEHRFVNAFLDLLQRRCLYCATAATGHARAIISERHLRDIDVGDGPSIYETYDLPRIAKLRSATAFARRIGSGARALQQMSFLRGVPTEFCSVGGGTFQRNDEYRALFHIIRQFLLKHARWYEGDDYSSITKLTWRMFEQWTFLRIVESFRDAGVDMREWSDALRQNLQSRFVLDFDRGLMFGSSEKSVGENEVIRLLCKRKSPSGI